MSESTQITATGIKNGKTLTVTWNKKEVKNGLVVSWFDDTGNTSYDDELSKLLANPVVLGGDTVGEKTAMKADIAIDNFFEKVSKKAYNGDKPMLEHQPNIIY